MDRIMRWYARQLLRPTVRIIVLVVFTVLFGLCVWSTTQLTQEFNVEDYVPEDSYTQPFMKAIDEYSTLVVPLAVYFRNVNQSDPYVQKQMRDFIDDVTDLPQVGKPPEYCWVRDMYDVLNAGNDFDSTEIDESSKLHAVGDSHRQQLADMAAALEHGNYTFEEKLDIVLKLPGIRDVYGGDIVQDPDTLQITASRCYIFIRNLDLKDIKEQIDMLHDQRDLTMEQPINQNREGEELPFFTFDWLYYYWQLVR